MIPEALYTCPVYPAAFFRLRRLLERLDATRARRVLDAGCGEGTPLLRIAEKGIEVRGFDFSPEMVEYAQELFRTSGLDPEWITQGDIKDFGSFSALVEDGKFDAAVCFGVIPHFENDRTALRNLHRALKPGGRAFIPERVVQFPNHEPVHA